MSSPTPVVSVICLTYNHAPYIRECIEGFLMQQTDFPFEVIIHDDASTDGTTDIVREYASRYPDIIKPIIQTENQYSKHHDFNLIMKTCLDASKGEYIAFCEGDDFWTDSQKLTKQVDILKANDQYSICYSDCTRLLANNEKVYSQHSSKEVLNLDELIKHGNKISTLTVLLRKKDLISFPFVEFQRYKWPLLDYPLWLWVLSKGDACHLKCSLANYRVLEQSASHSKDENKQFLFILANYEIQETLGHFLNQKNGFHTFFSKAIFLLKNIMSHPTKITRIKFLFKHYYK